MRTAVLAISLATASAFSPALRSRTRARPVPRVVIKAAADEHFPDVGKIPYEGPDSKNPMAFSYYNEGDYSDRRSARAHMGLTCGVHARIDATSARLRAARR